MNQADLKDIAGISFNVLAKMGRSKFIQWRICIKFAMH